MRHVRVDPPLPPHAEAGDDQAPGHPRRVALIGAMGVAVLSGALALMLRAPAFTALVTGAAVGLAGLTVWSVYHLASGRGDAFLLLAAPLYPLLIEQNASPLRVLATLLMLAPVAGFVGLFLRRPSGEVDLELNDDGDGPLVIDDPDDDDEDISR